MERTWRKNLVAMTIVCLLLPLISAAAPKEARAALKGTVTATSLYIREGPSTSYQKVQVNGSDAYLKNGETVELLSEKDGWYFIRTTFYGAKVEGYICGDYLKITGKADKPAPTPTPTPSATPTPAPKPSGKDETEVLYEIPASMTGNEVNLRKGPGTGYDSLGKLAKETAVTVINVSDQKDGRWYAVQAKVDKKSVTGYVLSDYVKLTLKSSVKATVSADKTKLRSGAGSAKAYLKDGDGKVVSLKKNKALTIKEEITADSVKWFKVSFTQGDEKLTGYIEASMTAFKVTEATPTPTPTPKPDKTAEPEETTEPVETTESTEPEETTEPKETTEPNSGSQEPSPTPTPTPVPTLTPIPTPTPTPVPMQVTGSIQNTSTLAVRVKAGFSAEFLSDRSGVTVLLAFGQSVTILGKVTADYNTWYHVGFYYDGYSYDGYVLDNYVLVLGDLNTVPAEDGSATGGGGQGTGTLTPTPTPAPSISYGGFETELSKFPESYQPYLISLHAKYPNWRFVAYDTGLDWNTAVDNEAIVGRNLIPNSKGIGWKSTAEKAYNWKTDSFIVYDGSSWVTASRQAIAYYMDPRNFLTDSGIFQFEVLTFENEYQTVDGVENILKYTPLSETSYNYTDANGFNQTISYGQTFMKAAEYSGVSPYHLASRVKQEVVTGTTTLSSSASGNFSGMEGYYNFYNIGAYGSTTAGGAVANGLKYAMNGSTSLDQNLSALIPWNNQYNAIVGGAYIIGSTYINRGQDTVYLQKFNVTATSTYNHQYMTNVEAPSSESRKTALAYPDASSLPLVFSIPVYLNMPSANEAAPGTEYNPNNWLKSLSVKDSSGNELVLTPEFDIESEDDYFVTVSADQAGVTIEAQAVSSKASVAGTGFTAVAPGTNTISVLVTAENGDVRTYRITVQCE